MSIGFYDNSILNFDYQPPCLIIRVKKLEHNEEEFIMSELVLKKFFEMKQNGKPIRFAYMFIIETINICDIPLMKRIGSILDKYKEKAKKQVFASSVVIDSNLSGVVNILKKLMYIFKNEVPTTFVHNIKDAKEFINKYRPVELET